MVRLYADDIPDGVPWLDAQGAPQGRDVIIPDVWVPQTLPATTDTDWPQTREGMVPVRPDVIGETSVIRLMAAQWAPPPPWEPGQRVLMRLRWEATRAPRSGDSIRLQGGAEGIPLGVWSLATPRGSAPMWPDGGQFFSVLRWRVPSTVSPGSWPVTLILHTPEGQGLYTFSADVMASTRVFTVPDVTFPVDTVFGDRVRLVGLDVSPMTVRPGEAVTITLTWQALREMERSYTGFVHILGPDGRVLAQEDHVPSRPTDTWIAGEVVQDVYTLTVPAEAIQGGQLVLAIGLYDALAAGMPRLPITQGEGDTAVRVILRLP